MMFKDAAVNSSTRGDWRRQRNAGAFRGIQHLGARPARPKAAEPHLLAAEVAHLQKSNADLTRRLARAEAILDIQKNWWPCWG